MAKPTKLTNLEDSRIPHLPDSIYYLPAFITPDEESQILASLPLNRWINLSHRRLQAHPTTLSKTNILLDAPLPQWLREPIISRFQSLGLFEESPRKAPNHVLVNEYLPNQGIMPHEDGGTYSPIVATVSLGASIVLDVYQKRADGNPVGVEMGSATREGEDQAHWRILQEPRSLLVTTGSAYTDLLHGIAEVDVDPDLTASTVANWELLDDRRTIQENGSSSVRGTRISLTYRDVLKVSKIGARIFGKTRH